MRPIVVVCAVDVVLFVSRYDFHIVLRLDDAFGDFTQFSYIMAIFQWTLYASIAIAVTLLMHAVCASYAKS